MFVILQSLWEYSSAGSERLPYKQEVTGSIPVTPTTESPQSEGFFRLFKNSFHCCMGKRLYFCKSKIIGK